jgi:uncharacterized membrane protein YhhN
VLVAFERAAFRPGIWLGKAVASSAFLGAAWAAGASGSGYGRLVLLALGFSWLGDLLLLSRGRTRLFLLGMVGFILAHAAYGAAFCSLAFSPVAFLAGAVASGAAAAWTYRWLAPHLTGVFRVAVPAYLAVIAAMLALAVSATAGTGRAAMAAGAAAFALSDLSVAYGHFIRPSWSAKAWGLPLYYAAQLVLAGSVRLVAH